MPPLLIIWLPISKNTQSPAVHVTMLDCLFIGGCAHSFQHAIINSSLIHHVVLIIADILLSQAQGVTVGKAQRKPLKQGKQVQQT
ncbi:hypothetical protein K443DRAFT_6699 [Laccaria amethystina LaAM-08-1]|uniref:Uncharacterized protein n=1 Tax=Laccaria amethystina LaAM-08-1 TaxID=1095629 RepID=A0A0C9XVH3_9AGAR|nr:hypothetical protein K443DRAFT_6699 [Laccaria amethystina LaAM-08-1]